MIDHVARDCAVVAARKCCLLSCCCIVAWFVAQERQASSSWRERQRKNNELVARFFSYVALKSPLNFDGRQSTITSLPLCCSCIFELRRCRREAVVFFLFFGFVVVCWSFARVVAALLRALLRSTLLTCLLSCVRAHFCVWVLSDVPLTCCDCFC